MMEASIYGVSLEIFNIAKNLWISLYLKSLPRSHLKILHKEMLTMEMFRIEEDQMFKMNKTLLLMI